ncbi:hypothetical protein DNC80_10335 [Flavobacterium sp. SOK18b]|uniref:hypothetical protein n=1 Tax=Flavobacterium sp. SOK18b TaxID=797900 RepID=UPI0015FE193A|nr:hypothetical protein [Flavobacterium sp. SOK18b]MBB1194059.1 hypothetical protein [Flavobacterium sp. SOK18b]
MKTNYGGCSNYSLPTFYYGGATTSFSYNISSDDGIWLCPIQEVGPYLIFDKKPSSYTLDYETYTDYNQTDIYELLASLNVTITKDCQTTIGYGASNLRPYFELISNQVLTSPGVNNVLTDKIKLKATGCSGTQRFHWEYKLNGGQFQKMNISTSFNEEFEFITANFIPLDYSGFVDFRVVIDSDPSITEENVYSNIISYNVTRKAPKIISTTSPNFTSCSYSKDGSVTFTFERELQQGEQYEMTLLYENGRAVLNGNKRIPKDSMTTPTTYTWNNLDAEKYILTYQTKKIIGNSELMSDPEQKSFTISSPTNLEFTVSANNPLCNNGGTNLIIEAIGGSPPYFYDDLEGTTELINGETKIKRIQFNPSDELSNQVSIPLLNTKSVYTIKVTDSKFCIER